MKGRNTDGGVREERKRAVAGASSQRRASQSRENVPTREGRRASLTREGVPTREGRRSNGQALVEEAAGGRRKADRAPSPDQNRAGRRSSQKALAKQPEVRVFGEVSEEEAKQYAFEFEAELVNQNVPYEKQGGTLA